MPKHDAQRLLHLRSRRHAPDRHDRIKHRVWLLGLAGFVTSVTIASLPSRESTAPLHLQGVLITPPQVLDIAPVSRLDDDAVHPATVPSTRRRDTIGVASIASAEELRWTEITVRRGETLSGILLRAGQDARDVLNYVRTHGEARAFHRLQPGRVLRLRTDADGRLQELTTATDADLTLRLRRSEGGFSVTQEVYAFETRLAHVTGAIEASLFEDGLAAGMSEGLILRLVEIFGWDIDFAQQIRRGDSFAVIHEEKFRRGQKIADGAILAAEFVNQGKAYRATAWRDAGGRAEYYTPEGLSLRRPFLRTPVEFSRISSRFSSRLHPIHKTWRAHTGVDYAAPTGTPVRATSAGRVTALGWNGGYGKAITIRHGGAYRTLYGHLSRFHSGMRIGGLVEQGQVIGYVGSTGLATGPHLHYELHVNGAYQNPLTFKFPAAAPIPAEHKPDFLRAAGRLSARLDLISRNISGKLQATSFKQGGDI